MALSSKPPRPGLLEALERLLEITSSDLGLAMSEASDVVASALAADKVDVFLYDTTRDSLIAVGSSHQPLSALQKRHGLDIMPLSNGGRAVYAFKTGKTFVSGDLENDAEELRGVKELLQVRSAIAAPLHVGGALRAVLVLSSQKSNHWSEGDVSFAESVSRWVGTLAHRSELLEEVGRRAVEEGRKQVADELVTVLAHDLRNYIAPVDLRLRTLLRRCEREERANDVRDLQLTLKGVARLSALISDMLDVARVDRGIFDLRTEYVALGPLLEETASAFETAEHPIIVKAAEDVCALADPARVRQCVENLLSNALKHSPRGAAVHVEISLERHEEGMWVRVVVTDEGPGISPDLLPSLFERFVRGAGSKGGLGLGLFLAKRIAVLHGGDLTVESAPGKGARFTLVLPSCDGSG